MTKKNFFAAAVGLTRMLAITFITSSTAVWAANYKIISDDETSEFNIEVGEGIYLHCGALNMGRQLYRAELKVADEIFTLKPNAATSMGACRFTNDIIGKQVESLLQTADSVYLTVTGVKTGETLSFPGARVQKLVNAQYVDIANIRSATAAVAKPQPVAKPEPSTKTAAEYIATFPAELRNVDLIEVDQQIKATGERNMQYSLRNDQMYDGQCMAVAYEYLRSRHYWNSLDSQIATANNFVNASKADIPKFSRNNLAQLCGDATYLQQAGGSTYHGKRSVDALCTNADPAVMRNYNPPGFLGSGLPAFCVDTVKVTANETRSCMTSSAYRHIAERTDQTKEAYCACTGKRFGSYFTGNNPYVDRNIMLSMKRAAEQYCVDGTSKGWTKTEQNWMGSASNTTTNTSSVESAKATQTKPQTTSASGSANQSAAQTSSSSSMRSTQEPAPEVDSAITALDKIEKAADQTEKKVSEGVNKLKGLFGK